jgi:hypothetical protein
LQLPIIQTANAAMNKDECFFPFAVRDVVNAETIKFRKPRRAGLPAGLLLKQNQYYQHQQTAKCVRHTQ